MKKKSKRPTPEWTRLPLLRSHGINFLTDGCGDAEKFVRAFKKAWNCIPEENRELLLEHWRQDSFSNFKFPVIELVSWKSDFNPDESQKKGGSKALDTAAFAVSTIDGLCFAFWQPVMDRLPDEHAAAVIVHELAHVVICILPGNEANPKLDDPDYVHDLIHQYLKMLGFNELTMFKWVRENAPELLKGQLGYDPDSPKRKAKRLVARGKTNVNRIAWVRVS